MRHSKIPILILVAGLATGIAAFANTNSNIPKVHRDDGTELHVGDVVQTYHKSAGGCVGDGTKVAGTDAGAGVHIAMALDSECKLVVTEIGPLPTASPKPAMAPVGGEK